MATGEPRTPAAIARFEREKANQRKLQREVLELRKAGYSYYRIAQVQGCSTRTALNRYKRAIARDIPEEEIIEARKLELDRYDEITVMNMALLARAFEAGDVETFCKIQDRINGVHDRRRMMIPIQVNPKLVIEQETTLRTAQDSELADLLGKAANDVEDKVRWLTEQYGGVGPDPIVPGEPMG